MKLSCSKKKILRKKYKPTKKGFTLLEMMVTLVLLAMILSMCYAILFATLESTEKVEAMAESGKAAQGVLQILSRDLEGVYSYDMEKTFVGKREFDQAEVFFTVWLPSPNSSKDPSKNQSTSLKKINYHLKKNPDVEDRWVLFRGVAEKDSEDFTYQEIFDAILKLDFQYWKNDSWVTEWKEKEPPKAVKITLKLAQKNFPSHKITTKKYTTVVSLPSAD